MAAVRTLLDAIGTRLPSAEVDIVRRAPVLLTAFCILASLACTVRPKASDTGYLGTWSRGNDRNVSIVSIAKSGDRYFFRWRKTSYDGKFKVDCDWYGRCEERLNGEKMATYEFSPRLDPATGHLMIESTERRLLPEKVDTHYLDELVVEPGGKVLWSYTVERDGQKFTGSARPMRSLDKVADGVGGVPPVAGR
ncbi:MAG: hypothetical protein LAO51_18655 [Acidobacteriia bacterium]|nr:hypothetical protein [Terriglobia bacterium]